MDHSQAGDEDSGHSSLIKKNKLGYTRISIACEHCRRRKIRCVKDERAAAKCANCFKLNKECIFTSIENSSPTDSKSKSKETTASGASSACQSSPTGSRVDGFDTSGSNQPGQAQLYTDSTVAPPYAEASRPNPMVVSTIVGPQQPQWMSSASTESYHAPPLPPAWSPHLAQSQNGAYAQGGHDIRQCPADNHFQDAGQMSSSLPAHVTYAVPAQQMAAPSFQGTLSQAQYYGQFQQHQQIPLYAHYNSAEHGHSKSATHQVLRVQQQRQQEQQQEQQHYHQHHHHQPQLYPHPQTVLSNHSVPPQVPWQPQTPLSSQAAAYQVTEARHDSSWSRASAFPQHDAKLFSLSSHVSQRVLQSQEAANPPD